MLERPQQHATPRMERRAASDVRMTHDEVDDGTDLRLRGWIRPRTLLLEFLPPARRKVAVEIEAMPRALDLQRVAVVVVVATFRQHAVIRAAGLDRITADHQSRLLRM